MSRICSACSSPSTGHAHGSHCPVGPRTPCTLSIMTCPAVDWLSDSTKPLEARFEIAMKSIDMLTTSGQTVLEEGLKFRARAEAAEARVKELETVIQSELVAPLEELTQAAKSEGLPPFLKAMNAVAVAARRVLASVSNDDKKG